jgi:hypothetical protein
MKKNAPNEVNEMRPEYHFDYSKARTNRFAGRIDKQRVVVVLDPDISAVFTTPESVKAVLRALIATMPKPQKGRRPEAADPPGELSRE